MHASAFNANRNPALPFIPCLTSTTRSTQDPGRHHAASPTSICTRPPAGSPERDLDCPKLGHPLEVLLDVCLANRPGRNTAHVRVSAGRRRADAQAEGEKGGATWRSC
eukprot:3572521-Rhodomonas_salina.1